jgi:hypothetical protein
LKLIARTISARYGSKISDALAEHYGAEPGPHVPNAPRDQPPFAIVRLKPGADAASPV